MICNECHFKENCSPDNFGQNCLLFMNHLHQKTILDIELQGLLEDKKKEREVEKNEQKTGQKAL